MHGKRCPHCSVPVTASPFFSAVSSIKGSFCCPDCGGLLKRDISIYSGLLFFLFTAVLFPLAVIFGLSARPGGFSGSRIESMLGVGPGAALAIVLGFVAGLLGLLYAVGYLLFRRMVFDKP